MIGPRIMVYTIVDFGVRIACSFSTKFPNSPILSMFVIKEFDECVCWISVSTLRIGGGGTRSCNDWPDISLRGVDSGRNGHGR